MKTRALVAACFFGCSWITSSTAQQAPRPAPSPTPERLRAVAVRWEAPASLSVAARRELDATLAAADNNRIDEALGPWRALLARERDRAEPSNTGICVDYVLNRVAASRNAAAGEACRRARYYDTQESLILEHLTTTEKQLSAYGESAVTAAPLREPELGAYGDGADPATLAPGVSAGAKELQASLAQWRERLPAISEARESAITAFVESVLADPSLVKEIEYLEVALRAEIHKPAADKP